MPKNVQQKKEKMELSAENQERISRIIDDYEAIRGQVDDFTGITSEEFRERLESEHDLLAIESAFAILKGRVCNEFTSKLGSPKGSPGCLTTTTPISSSGRVLTSGLIAVVGWTAFGSLLRHCTEGGVSYICPEGTPMVYDSCPAGIGGTCLLPYKTGGQNTPVQQMLCLVIDNVTGSGRIS